ncbi:MAG: amidotransferase 1, exosortase A system-associated [Magnetococcales bacterium]|nr:amidotransferase 1, exosortase A system-associated [Magnetococcales bacterium]
MCGIVGLFDLKAERCPDPDTLERMNQCQSHRGPDGGGLHIAPGIGLGHRRLSIIDLAGGRQPLFNEDGQIAVVFNGEIYNFQTLTHELQTLGHHFASRSDTEILVHGWEEWGVGITDRLRGMFAFAIHDQRTHTLFLARDRLGIKPLHYAILNDGWLAFASELKGITAHPDCDRTFNPRAVECFFALGYVPDPLTIYGQAHKLAPGYRLKIVSGQPVPHPECYWDLDFTPRNPCNRNQAREELLVRLQEAVQSHLVADVELASFLSGGVDSSAVSALMARTQNTPVTACTVAFADSSFDETHWATQTAKRHGLHHVVEQAQPHHFHLLDRLAWHHDEPFADHSSIPTWIVCEMARKHVKVVLSGDGGDESLAGYERYRFVLAEEMVKKQLPLSVRQVAFGALCRWYPKADRLPRWLRFKSTLQSLAKDSIDGYFHAVSIIPWELRQQLYSPSFLTSLQGYRAEEVFRAFRQRAPEHPLERMQYIDFKTFLAGRVLTKVDRASMAHGLEVRVPILDHELVEWMIRLPPRFKIHRGVGKALLKEALTDLLGKELLYRRKMGFIAPIAQWLRNPLAGRLNELTTSEQLFDFGGLNKPFLRWMIDEHLQGRRNFSQPLWAVLQYDACLKNILTG